MDWHTIGEWLGYNFPELLIGFGAFFGLAKLILWKPADWSSDLADRVIDQTIEAHVNDLAFWRKAKREGSPLEQAVATQMLEFLGAGNELKVTEKVDGSSAKVTDHRAVKTEGHISGTVQVPVPEGLLAKIQRDHDTFAGSQAKARIVDPGEEYREARRQKAAPILNEMAYALQLSPTTLHLAVKEGHRVVETLGAVEVKAKDRQRWGATTITLTWWEATYTFDVPIEWKVGR